MHFPNHIHFSVGLVSVYHYIQHSEFKKVKLNGSIQNYLVCIYLCMSMYEHDIKCSHK